MQNRKVFLSRNWQLDKPVLENVSSGWTWLNMSNLVPGRPRRQQAYRRTNTSLGLAHIPDNAPDPDPYISCTNILDKFNGSSSGMANGSPLRKSSTGIKDFLLGRQSSATRKESSSSGQHPADSAADLVPQWSVQESVIDDLRISNIPRQPKYSYLIGKSAQKDDFWRKSNAVNIVNNNSQQYNSSSRQQNQPQEGATSSSYFLPQHNSSSSKRLNDYHHVPNTNNVQSAASAAYEDRMNAALRKAPSGSAGNASVSSAVQKSKSYSNFDFVRRDLNFQVCNISKKNLSPKGQKGPRKEFRASY